jgi:hypothetical protein
VDSQSLVCMHDQWVEKKRRSLAPSGEMSKQGGRTKQAPPFTKGHPPVHKRPGGKGPRGQEEGVNEQVPKSIGPIVWSRAESSWWGANRNVNTMWGHSCLDAATTPGYGQIRIA